MVSVDAARAVYGQGLKGDRYATAEGTFSRPGAAGREVTLIETEALEALEREYDVALGPGDRAPAPSPTEPVHSASSPRLL